jgi:prepilin-type N-terminal cleavage/methylation domain-containing protein
MRARAAGFTLLEVVVALTIGSLALLGASALLAAIDSRADAITVAQGRQDRSMNSERVLRLLATNVALPDSGLTVTGDERGARFISWCETPAGWLARCQVQLAVEPTEDGATLRVRLVRRTRDDLTMFSDAQSIRIRYLRTADEGGRWDNTWSNAVRPAALGIIVDRDTLVLPFGHDD